jgi:hypothetical protein
MGVMAGWFIAGLPFSALRFKKGAIACIEVERLSPPCDNELLWFLTPKQLDAIAK